MSDISEAGRGSGLNSGTRAWMNPLLTQQGRDALARIESSEQGFISPTLLQSHRDTEELRLAAERYRRRRRANVESFVEFEFDAATNRIVVKIKDELTGEVKLRLTPEEVERILRDLEETSDNDCTLASFFIDLKMS